MHRLILSALVFAAVAAAFWLVGSGPTDTGESDSRTRETAALFGADGAARARTSGAPVPLPGAAEDEDRDEPAASETPETALESDPGRGEGRSDRGTRRFGSEALVGATGGGRGTRSISSSSSLRSTLEEPTPTPTPEEVPEPVVDLEAEAAEIAESLGLLEDDELEGRVDRALVDGSQSGPEADRAREDARQSVLADAAICEALLRQRYGPDALPAQLNAARGMCQTLLSILGEDRRNEILAQLPEVLAAR